MTYPDSGHQYLPQRPVTAEDRDRVVESLCLHFAADHLGMESLEQRLQLAYDAQTVVQLQQTIMDLPALQRDKMDSGSATVVPANIVPASSTVMAVFGGVARKGSWIVPRHVRILAMFGGAEIDLREAKFAPGLTEIDANAIFGGIEITVPPGVRVESHGGAFMGGFDASAGDAGALDPSAPVLRVAGIAIFGGVEVKVRKPGKKMLARFQAALHAAGLLGELDD